MNRIVLHQIPYNIVTLYQDKAASAIEQAKADALKSPPVVWAKSNNCKIEVTNAFDNVTGEGAIVYYAALSPIQQTEFALRF